MTISKVIISQSLTNLFLHVVLTNQILYSFNCIVKLYRSGSIASIAAVGNVNLKTMARLFQALAVIIFVVVVVSLFVSIPYSLKVKFSRFFPP